MVAQTPAFHENDHEQESFPTSPAALKASHKASHAPAHDGAEEFVVLDVDDGDEFGAMMHRCVFSFEITFQRQFSQPIPPSLL
jgi:hypothetical protein